MQNHSDVAKKSDGGTKIIFLASLIALLIAITGIFSLDRIKKVENEFLRVAREDIPLSAAIARIETLQSEQTDIIQRVLQNDLIEGPGKEQSLFTETFLRIGTRLKKALDEGMVIAQGLEQKAKSDRGQEQGRHTVQHLWVIANRHVDFEKQAIALLEQPAAAGEKPSREQVLSVEKMGSDLQAQAGTLLNEVETFTLQSADAVTDHSREAQYVIMGFTIFAYVVGVFLLLGIHKLIKGRRQAASQLEFMATHDPLSGLFNRRHFLNQMEMAVAAAHRYEHALSLCICDLDGFKQVNDEHGHGAGDQVIKQFGALIRKEIRADDFAGRYGGDEFCVALNHTPAMTAGEVLERIRKAMEKLVFQDTRGTYFQVSATFGLSDLSASQPSTRVLIEMADQALYQAKRSGRNCVVIQGVSDDMAGGSLPQQDLNNPL